MQHRVQIQPIPHYTPHPGLHLEHAVRADDKLVLLPNLDPHLARRDAAQPRLISIRFQPQHVARRHRVDVERDVLADGDGVRGGEVGF
jgi:hypothetical protein